MTAMKIEEQRQREEGRDGSGTHLPGGLVAE